jgi:regulation of enolase protein 1 (concanavalin A-like superfamily)
VGGSLYTSPASISLAASASDSDGTITRVDFYDGATLIGSDATSPFGMTWTDAGEGAHSLTAVAVDNQLGATTSAPIPVSAQAFAGWSHQDVGTVGAAGDASYASGSFTVLASGVDIAAAADEFHFVYLPVSGNATIVARVASQSTNSLAKGGVMFRESLAANSRHASMFLTRGSGLTFQRRTTAGAFPTNTQGPSAAAPYWVRLVRSGSTFSAYASPDGTAWTYVGSTTIALPSSVLVGLALTSRKDGTVNTSTFDGVSVLTDAGNASPTISVASPLSGSVTGAPGSVSIQATASDGGGTVARVDFYQGGSWIGADATAPYSFDVSGLSAGAYAFTAIATDDLNATAISPPAGVTVSASAPPSPWLDADVGPGGALGSADFVSPTFTLRGAGADIGLTADEFHYTYQPASGNVTIIARVATLQNTDPNARAGVMIRESLAPGSRHASVLLTPSNGLAFQRRAATGGFPTSTAGPLVTAPYWVKLVRSGSTFSAYHSTDGAEWTLVGSATVSMPANVLVGLALTSHKNATLNTSTLDGVAVTSP